MWENNFKHGKGSFFYAFGDVYEGEFRDNDRAGQGNIFFLIIRNFKIFRWKFL